MVPKIEASPKQAPRIASVKPQNHLVIEVTWSVGPRVGKTDIVNLSPILLAAKFFRPLRDNPELFNTVHRIDGGTAIAWGDDDEIDLSAASIQNLAEETMSPADLKLFIADYNLTETALAATLDYSRRQIVSFVAGEAPIPRVVSLACRYIALKHPRAPRQEPRLQPCIFQALMASQFSTSNAQHTVSTTTYIVPKSGHAAVVPPVKTYVGEHVI